MQNDFGEVKSCLKNAKLGPTKPDAADANRLLISLEGCPHKQGFTGSFVKIADGTWRVGGL